jgi:rod shape determining protein RodA
MRIPSSLAIYRKRWDPYLVIATAGLILIGMLAVYSATEFPDSSRAGFFSKHLLAIPLALGAMVIAMAVPLRVLDDLAYVLYSGAVVLLVAVLVVGMEVYGARRWLGYGPIRLQPSEVAKVTACLALAHFLVAKRRDPASVSNLLIVLGLIGLPLVLVLKEPDLGTSGAFAVMGFTMLLWGGLPWLQVFLISSPLCGLILCRHYFVWGLFLACSLIGLWRVRLSWLALAAFVVIQVAVLIGAPMLWNHLEPYQKARLTTFENPEKDPSGAGYQIMQSKIAIGSGGIWGKGYLKGSQKALAFLPQQHTDFIFSVVGEEFGFLGSAVTIVLFLILVVRGYYLALHCRSPFSGLVSVGISTLLLYHAGVNMGMTVGLLPVTGLPLPLVSYGGSFQVSVLAMIGILMNVSAHRFDY